MGYSAPLEMLGISGITGEGHHCGPEEDHRLACRSPTAPRRSAQGSVDDLRRRLEGIARV
jgi:hypothetical protein